MSEQKKAFKVWSCDRFIKKAFCCEANLKKVIKKGNEFGINGSKIVLEEDGTQIEDNDTLNCFCEKTFMLLEDNAEWIPVDKSPHESTPTNQEYDLIYVNTSNVSASESTYSNMEKGVLTSSYDSSLSSPSSYLSDTLSMSSGALSTESNDSNIGIVECKKLFADYKVSWQKLPSNILHLLENGLPLKSYFNYFIHFIVDEMRAFSFYIPVPVMRRIAQQALSKYPKSLGTINDK